MTRSSDSAKTWNTRAREAALGRTQDDLASLAGVDQSRISRWLRDRVQLTISQCRAIYAGAPPLLGDSAEVPPLPPPGDPISRSQMIDLLGGYGTLVCQTLLRRALAGDLPAIRAYYDLTQGRPPQAPPLPIPIGRTPETDARLAEMSSRFRRRSPLEEIVEEVQEQEEFERRPDAVTGRVPAGTSTGLR